ncbi:protein of unknown function [Candidatus Filomicrobium marinum]|nr:protein of unknown function [Candidatus Filomicrobium marinum]
MLSLKAHEVRGHVFNFLRFQCGLTLILRSYFAQSIHLIVGRHQALWIEPQRINQTQPYLPLAQSLSDVSQGRSEIALEWFIRNWKRMTNQTVSTPAIKHDYLSALPIANAPAQRHRHRITHNLIRDDLMTKNRRSGHKRSRQP